MPGYRANLAVSPLLSLSLSLAPLAVRILGRGGGRGEKRREGGVIPLSTNIDLAVPSQEAGSLA